MRLPGIWVKVGSRHIRALFTRKPTFAERFSAQYEVDVRRFGWLVIENHEWDEGRVRFKVFFPVL
jgi:hypothetical protein